MKMKEFGPPGGGARPWRPPLDPPMYLPPANEVCEGYVFTRVCTSVHRGEYLGRYPHRDQVHPPPPQDQIHPLDQVHPPGPGKPPHGPGTSPLGPSTPPTLDQAHTPPEAVHAGRYGQQAGCTHPTGMHSSFILLYFR